MEYFYDYDYWQLARGARLYLLGQLPDVAQARKTKPLLACYTAMYHDMMRSLKGGKPFVLMESTPRRHQLAADQQAEEAGDAYSLLAAGGGARRRLPCSTSSGGKAAVRWRNSTGRLSTTWDILIRVSGAK
jgi:beta-galactosidase GanA